MSTVKPTYEVLELKVFELERTLENNNTSIGELPFLKQDYDTGVKESFVAGFQNDISGGESESELTSQYNLLSKLTQFSIDLSMLSSDDNMEEFICKRIKDFTGAIGVVFSEFDHDTRLLVPKHIELQSGLHQKILNLIGGKVQNVVSPVNDEIYSIITKTIIRSYDSLTTATFGAISSPISAILSGILGANRYIGIAFLIEGNLYGTSLFALNKNQPTPSFEVLENLAFLIAVSLRRKQAEQDLKKSMERNKALLDANPDIMLVFDSACKIIDYHSNSADLLLFEPDFFIGKAIGDLFPLEIAEMTHQKINSVITTGKADYSNYDLTIGGQSKKFEARYVLSGRNEVLAIVRDITDQKIAEENLIMAKESYRDIFNSVTEAIYVLDETGSFIDVNKGAEVMYGFDRSELIGQSPLTVAASGRNNMVEIQNMIRKVSETGNSSNFDFWAVRKNGEIFPKEVIVNKGNYFGKDVLIATARDVTDRKQAEEALTVSSSNLQSLINREDSIWSIDNDYNLIVCNDFFRNAYLLNYNCVLNIGANLIGILPPELKEFWKPKYDEALSGMNVIFEFDEVIQDVVSSFSVSLVPIYTLEKITGVSALALNITDRKRAEEDVKLKNIELQNLNNEKDKFFSIIAHDLRSPFNTFLGFTELMVEDLDNMTLSQIQEIALDMKKSAYNLYNLLENLLQWSKIQRGIVGFQPCLFILNSTVLSSVHAIQESAAKKGVKITVSVPKEVNVFGDENMIESVIRNLVSNAVKFTNRGGNIDILAKYGSDDQVEISVSDNGIGMSNDMLAKLFRIDKKTTRTGTEYEPGSGLGLIICKDFIDKHGGKIWVQSQEGIGSTFKVMLKKG